MPYWHFMPIGARDQLWAHVSDTPCLRARSAVFAPASASFNTPIICSSVNRDRFIVRPFFRADSNPNW